MATKYVVAARIDENGNISGGSAGDQTGNEVCVHTLASSGSWTYILRPPTSAKVKMVKEAYAAAANDNIGYDQNQRTTLYTCAKAAGLDLSKITTKCECDCSALIAVLAICAGLSVSKDMYTGNEVSALTAVGFTKKTYSESALEVGDVLWRSGHTAIYVGTSKTYSSSDSGSSGSTSSTSKTATDSAKSKDSSLAGTYTATANLNVRNGAGTSKSIMVTIPKGTSVKNYGYYTTSGGVKWLYIQFTYSGVTYTGFASSEYLSKSGSSTSSAGSSTSSSGSKTLASAQSKDASLAGTYKTTTALNLRYGPDSDKYASMVVMPSGTSVRNYGYYTLNGSVKWLYVVATVNGKQYTGFCSASYLKKS